MARLPSWLSLGSLVLLLAILAWYQYRWTGEVSRAERARMRGALTTVLEAYANDFDRELTRLALTFTATGPGGTPAELAHGLTAARERWQESAADPRMLRSVWVARIEEDGDVSLHRLDPDAATLNPAPWPPALTPARRRIESLGTAFPRGGRVHATWPIPLAPEIPALILPADELRDVVERSVASEARRPILQSFLILDLDAAHLREVVFPGLSRRYNLVGETSSYDIAIVDRAGDRVYGTGPTPSTESHPADGSARLFDFLSFQAAEDVWRELGEERPPRLTPPAVFRDRQTVSVHREDPGAGPRTTRIMVLARGSEARRGEWQILAFHRQGSLDAVVSQARTRNLLVVAASLALLAASVGFLIVSNRRARDLALRQMDFVAAMTHELRTPLATIRSLGENLAHGIVPAEDQARRYGAMIVRQEGRLAQLVEDVLEFSGMGLAPSSRTRETVDARTVVAEAIEETRSLFTEAGASLETDLPARARPVRADPEALSQAVQNLLSNAVKFGGRRPQVSIHLDGDEKAREVRIAVSDRGPGIAADDLPHVFEPFFRAAAARAAKLPGSGLGLSLVERIVTAHDGRVDVESRAGQRTTFTIRLPEIADANP